MLYGTPLATVGTYRLIQSKGQVPKVYHIIPEDVNQLWSLNLIANNFVVDTGTQ